MYTHAGWFLKTCNIPVGTGGSLMEKQKFGGCIAPGFVRRNGRAHCTLTLKAKVGMYRTFTLKSYE